MGRFPNWYKGSKIRCDICGFEYEKYDGNLRKQRGLNVDRECFDSLTEEQRQTSINKRRR